MKISTKMIFIFSLLVVLTTTVNAILLFNTQQTMLAQELEGNPMENTQTQPYIDGELLFLGLQAFGRRSGMGELVFSKQ